MFKSTFKILVLTIAPLISLSFFAEAADLTCSRTGYTIEFINGINNTESDTSSSAKAFYKDLGNTYNGEFLKIKYLYNPTHGFASDFDDAIKQKLLEARGNVQDDDFVRIFSDAKKNITTQKVLLVAHSQGNFYANTLFDTVVDRAGGLPFRSVGMYSIASPANRVSGGGEYITSSNDKVIAGIVAKTSTGYTLPANDTLEKTSVDKLGHGLLEIYLNQRPDKIVGGISRALGRLSVDSNRAENTPCLNVSLSQPTTVVVGKIIAEGLIVGMDKTIDNAIFAKDVAVAKVASIAVAVGAAITNTTTSIASGLRDVVTGVISENITPKNNSASIILATQPTTQSSPQNSVQPPVVVVTNNKPLIPAPLVSQQPILSPQALTEDQTFVATTETASVATVSPTPKLALSGSSASGSGGGGGGGASPVLLGTTTPDITPPVITILGADPATSTVGVAYVDLGATAYDTIDGVRPVVSTSTVDIMTLGDYAVTYTTSDNAGNIATTSRRVTIVPLPIIDTTPPVITIIGANSDSVVVGNDYVDPGATALDDIDGDIAITSSSTVNTTLVGNYEINYTAMDNAGNSATSTRAVNVISGFETPTAPLFSDLNNNKIADSSEEEVIVDKNVTLSAGEYQFNNLVLTGNAVLTMAGDTTASSMFKGVKIFATNLFVATSSRISADVQGYDSSPTSPGTNPTYKRGASYGGVGVYSEGKYIYGSAFEPTDLGSGGGSCCSNYQRGGGAIRLVVEQELKNDGVISSDGAEAGSGGSIYVSSGTLSGVGKFQANGGRGSAYGVGGSGGGGRIAAYYRNSSFLGDAEARGGSFYDGWCCTSYAGSGSVLFIDITKNNITIGGSFIFKKERSPFVYNQIIVKDGASSGVESGVVVKAQSLDIKKSSSFGVPEGAYLETPVILVEDHSTLVSGGVGNLVVDTLSIVGGSMLTSDLEKILNISVNKLILEKGSSISSDQKGKGKWLGTSDIYYVGGSYGGVGLWNVATSTYGSKEEPVDFGSGGSTRGVGGGAIRLAVTDTFENNGVVSSNGGETSSGGSIYVTTNKLSGNGNFLANGGAYWWSGRYHGMGSGGRIAVYYTSSLFSGVTKASGACATFDSWTKTCSADGTVVMSDILPRHLSSEKIITSFSAQIATSTVVGIVDEVAHTISLSVPFGTDITALAPTLEISPLATSSPASLVEQDFTNSIKYVVTAEDGSQQSYVVTVVVGPEPMPLTVLSAERVVIEFSIQIATSTISGVIDEASHTVNATVPFGTDVRALAPTVIVSPLATSTPASGVLQDFTNPVVYMVTAEDGSDQPYIVTMTVAPEVVVLPSGSTLSSEHAITAFGVMVATSTILGIIDENTHTISLEVPVGVDVHALSPVITVSPAATLSPASGAIQDFTNPVDYTVIAEDGSSQLYAVTINVALDTAPPVITNYTFNGNTGDVVADFATTTPSVNILLTANENTNWVSLKIESQDAPSNYKTFFSGEGCVDGTASCAKTWDGVLSSGVVAPNGAYRVKVNIKDVAGNTHNDYLSPYVIMVNREVVTP